MLTYQPKIAFRDVRESGVRDVLVYYCRDHQCSHHIAISADRWPDHVRL
jgi:GT2 family glycosyltransferase